MKVKVGLVGGVAEITVDEMAEEGLLDFGGNNRGCDQETWRDS